jgi:hypothetical protein
MSWHPTALASLRAAYPTGGWHSDTGDIFGAIGGRLVIVTRDRVSRDDVGVERG